MKAFNFLHKCFSNEVLSYTGVVRDSLAVLVFYVPKSVFNPSEPLRVYALSSKDKTYDIEVVEVENSKIKSLSGFFIHAKSPADIFLNLTRYKFFINSNEAVCADEKYSLTTLVHHSYENFQQSFSFASGRIVDEETSRFVARNNMLYSKAFSGTVKVTSFSIYVYKSISTGIIDHSELNNFFDLAKSNVEFFSEEEASSSSIRSDVIGRALSITLAYCHYLIAYGDPHAVKNCIIELISFYDEVGQSRSKKTKLEDCSYLYFKLVCIGLLAAWKTKDFYFLEFLKKKAVEIYRYASSRSSDLPYVYLKEFGETYSSFLIFTSIFQKENLSLEDLFLLAKSALRVKTKNFLDQIVKNKDDILSLFPASKIVSLDVSPTVLSHAAVWLDFSKISSGRYCFEAFFSSEYSSAKACIFCIRRKGVIEFSDAIKVRGLTLSENKNLGFFKYISLKEGDNHVRFEFEVENEYLDQCSLFLWDKNVNKVTYTSFALMELCFDTQGK